MNRQYSEWGHQAVCSSVMHGTVTRIGYYRDSLPKLVITVKKTGLLPIPYQDGARFPITFVIKGKCFTAGVRSTNHSATVMISPDLNDAESNPVRLTDLLYDCGWTGKDSHIELRIEDGAISFC